VKEVWFSGVHCGVYPSLALSPSVVSLNCWIRIDVGGGSVVNATSHSLARIALRWMIRECFRTNSGIMFVSSSLKSIGLNPVILYTNPHTRRPDAISLVGQGFFEKGAYDPLHEKPKGRVPIDNLVPEEHGGESEETSEEELEGLDARSPMYDQLQATNLKWLLWHISEYLPLHQSYQQWGTEKRIVTRALHRSKGRVIPTAWSSPPESTWTEWFCSWLPWSRGYAKLPTHTMPKTVKEEHKVLVHRSVKMRMQARGNKSDVNERYIPKAVLGSASVKWDDCDEYVEWVD
jgi:hypothetical protein